ncbi:hypothetical protein F442_22299 [Phytophthora nicotianae P10297]|uniref:Uncharacterized protein n=1 Tax=Phytophthora nicotianae P10297 TaxID=1317064 RepID=W2Y0Z3_PHYNI|nr:hypothetical protein F442_22299 [Phytophthora nicotianae P10297]
MDSHITDEETEQQPKPHKRRVYSIDSVFPAVSEVLFGMAGTTGMEYKLLYHYGKKGWEDDTKEVVILEESSDHAEELSVETKIGIPLRLKRKCRKLLSRRLSSQPNPSVSIEKQLNNRKAYLKKKAADATNFAAPSSCFKHGRIVFEDDEYETEE